LLTATAARPLRRNSSNTVQIFAALAVFGFRRYATYRQAALAGAVTNVVFGFLRCYVLLAVAAGAAGVAAGYDGRQLATFVWAGQGLLAVVLLWGWTDLAERIRSGDIASDLLRPVSPVVNYLATDLGRAGFAVVTRFLPPVAVGLIFFDLYIPQRWWTPPLFALSAVLAVISCFGCRYLVNAVTYWILDARGVMIAWALGSGILSGLYFPLRFLPDGLVIGLWVATPFPGLMQSPLDVLVERDPPPIALAMLGAQAVWTVLILAACRAVQRRAERRMVVQGG
jgi:ABC-2 type transport system permease protein